MRIKISLYAEKPICLTFKYNLAIRGLIYHLLPYDFATFLHDSGYKYQKRNFKMFTFSRVQGKLLKQKIQEFPLVFQAPIKFYVASPINQILEYIASNSIVSTEIYLEKNRCILQSIEVERDPNLKSKLKIRMLSPMTIRSTLKGENNRSKSYYYSPYEADFSLLMTRNIQKKYKTIYNKEINGFLNIKPIKNIKKRVIIGDNNFVIKAWDGIYELSGPKELITLSYFTGLGEKNSQGFGMWEVWKGKVDCY